MKFDIISKVAIRRGFYESSPAELVKIASILRVV